MAGKNKYVSSYAGYVYNKPITHWSSTEEVMNHLTEVDLSKPGKLKAGGMPLLLNGNTAYIDASDGHTAVIAISGMKKSICAFMPLIRVLAGAGENMILTDPKGELYDRTAGYLSIKGYKTYCLDFRTMNKDCYNILRYPATMYRRGDKDRGLSVLSDIVNAFAEEQRRCAKDPFWPDTGAQWLNSAGAMMLDAYPDIDKINVLNWSDFNVRASVDMIEEYILGEMPDGLFKSSIKQTCTSAENTLRSILITASSFLSMFNQNPKLAAMLSSSTFTLDDLTKPKRALYLVTDDTTSTADPILGIIISQIQSFLVDKAYHSKGGKLRTRMNFVLDEFASIPIPNMDKALATHRSRNIRYYLCCQSLALLKKRYTEPEALLANCNSTLYLGSTELELLQQLETKLGKTYISPDGLERPLCPMAELMTLEKTWEYKEAIYLNLSAGIRFCTKLPAIEAYKIGDEPPVEDYREPPHAQIYSVSSFVNDVLSNRIHAPFAYA